MKPVVVSDVLAVGEFPTPDQLAILAKAGFKAILNNQPDGEVARFDSAAHVEAEAKRHGLAYAYAPLSSRTPPAEEMTAYAAAIEALPSPIYAFCYSGARSAAGCALLLTRTMDVDAIITDFTSAGFDMSALRPWLDDERARHTGQAPAKDTAAARSEPLLDASGAALIALPSATVAVGPTAQPPASPARRPERAEGMPRMVIVHPRAAGYGGFAM